MKTPKTYTFTFNSRESYLQYRTEWKAKYAKLSDDIRDFKFCRKLRNVDTERYDRVKKAHATQWGFWPQSLAFGGRLKAADMLEELKAAKAEAQRQYLAQKAAQMAA